MVTQTNDDRQTFRLLRPGASSVELIGSFTGWHDGAIQMEAQELQPLAHIERT